MTLIVQAKRLLITEFDDDHSLSKFLKWTTVENLGMYNEVVKTWTAAFETQYNGQPCIAIPKRFNRQFLNTIVDANDTEKDIKYLTARKRTIKNETEPRTKQQQEMLEFLLGINTYKLLNNKPRRALFANTGTGKTFLTLKTISERGELAFINCPDKKAIMTWQQEIAKFTDIKPDEIAVLQGRESLPRILKNIDKYKIIIGSGKTFSSLIISNDFELIEEFFREARFGIIVHDEVHLNLMVVFFIEMMTNNPFTLYLTATPNRRIYKEGKILESLLPPENCIYREEAKARFTFTSILYHSNPIKEHSKGLSKPSGFDYINYGKKIIFNPNDKLHYGEFFKDEVLLKTIRLALKKRSSKTTKVAVLCRTKAENEIVFKYLQEYFKDQYTIGLFNSDIVDMDERFKETERDIIISTDKSFAGIINIKNLEIIINLYPISSDAHILQIMGRIRDEKIILDNGEESIKKPIFYQLCDGSFPRCKKALYKETKAVEDHVIDFTQITVNKALSSLDMIEED